MTIPDAFQAAIDVSREAMQHDGAELTEILMLVREHESDLLGEVPGVGQPWEWPPSWTRPADSEIRETAQRMQTLAGLVLARTRRRMSQLAAQYASLFRGEADRLSKLQQPSPWEQGADGGRVFDPSRQKRPYVPTGLLEHCGRLIIEADRHGLRLPIKGLRELIDLHTGDASADAMPEPGTRQAVKVRCPSNLFLDVAGGNAVLGRVTSDGKVEIVINPETGTERTGGLLSESAPGLLRLPDHNRYAEVCRTIADMIAEHWGQPGAPLPSWPADQPAGPFKRAVTVSEQNSAVTFGQLYVEVYRHESSRAANQAIAAAASSPQGAFFAGQFAGPWEVDWHAPNAPADVRRFAEIVKGRLCIVTPENLERIRNEICQRMGCGPDVVNAMSLDDAADALQGAAAAPGPLPIRVTEPTVPVPTADEISEICRNGEDQLHEFKGPGTDVKKITREIAAMLNTRNGGMVLYGVDDDGTILGSDLSRQEMDQPLQNSIRNTVSPAGTVTLHSIEVAGAVVLVIIVPPWNRRDVYHFEDRVQIRKGTNVFAATADENRKLHSGEFVI